MIQSGNQVQQPAQSDDNLYWEKINRKLDYCPGLSTIINLAKIILKVAVYIHPPSEGLFQRWHIIDLHSKSLSVCFLLLIPGINIIVAGARDEKPKDQPAKPSLPRSDFFGGAETVHISASER